MTIIGKPWPGFGPGTFALPRLKDNILAKRDSVSNYAGPNPIQGLPHYLEGATKFRWDKYGDYLDSTLTRHTARCRLLYARKYCHVLTDSNAQELFQLSNDTRIHVMKSLATLSKYLGCYDRWREIKARYQLKWSNENSFEAFTNIMMNNNGSYSSMLYWLKNTRSKIPSEHGNILLYCTLTGLRPEEAVQSLRILHTTPDNYLKEGVFLEHFRYPEIFIRRTKKAYISIATNGLLETAKLAGDYSYNALRMVIKKKGLKMNMAFCRKIFATFLHIKGVDQETIDLLQGRAPRSVFARHYFRPDCNFDRIKSLLDELYHTLVKSQDV